MVPLSSLRGNKDVVRYYELLKLEIEERVKANDAAVPDERYRLGWDHLPIYHKTKYLSNLFSKYGGVFVVAPFLDITAHDLTIYDQFEMNITMMEKGDLDFSKFSAEKILELLTHEYSMIYVNRNLDYKAKHISSLVDEYSLDGFVFHLNRGCKSQCLSQYRLQQMIKEKFGINSLIIDGDSMDPRFFSENQITTRIEAFMESLRKRKNSQRSNAPYSF
jgi:benzoyl-CoA reductase/2-hydroxyglutaryl-CoA dehydratase subunit BcrC/BadD/HgdB